MKLFFTSANRMHLQNPNVIVNLKLKMIGLFTLLIIGMLAIIGVFLHYLLADTFEEQIGKQALGVAQSVANIPELVAAFEEKEPATTIQQIVAPIREATGAEFIVVGNIDELRYSHPNPEKIGQRMIGEDNERALIHGESYISKAVGSLGPSLRGKVPVKSENGEVIGVVSVGFLVDDVQGIVQSYSRELWVLLSLIGVLGIIGAIFVATYIKKILFGLEPEEISHLFLQKESILQSTHEGILAVNQKGNITLMNAAAQTLLFNKETDQHIGQSIKEVLPASQLPDVLANGVSQFNQELKVGKRNLLVNRVPIYYEKSLIGAVSTFRDKTEVESLTLELSRVKQYAEGLRAQTHEFSNKLSTILGLLHLNKKQDAIEFIKKEHNLQQEWIHMVIDKVSDPMLSAILLGKIAQASEHHIMFTIDPNSQLNERLTPMKREALLTALGNLIDNAMDEVKHKQEEERRISIFFTDIGDEVLFEIEDAGDGVSAEAADKIFLHGFSTKAGEYRGIGLALAMQMISDAGGNIYLEESELGGACFVVSIPKDKGRGSSGER